MYFSQTRNKVLIRTPEAVRTGLAFSLGRREFLCSCGTAAMISTSLGEVSKPYFDANLDFNLFNCTSLPSS